MSDLYTLCAIIGGTLFLCQLLLSLFGIGGEHETDAAAGHDVGHDSDHATSHGIGLHGMFSFRALVVGLTLFGLTGRVAQTSQLSALAVALIAAGAGIAGLVLIALLMQGLYKLEAEGNVHIEQALGEEAVVYLTIPAKRSGVGKITVTVQNRLMEFTAVTDGDAIPTGTPVEVVDLVDEQTLRVAAIPKPATDTEQQVTSQRQAPGREAQGGTHA